MPPPRGRGHNKLRCPKIFQTLTVNSIRFRKSFLPYCLNNFEHRVIYYTINILLAFYIIYCIILLYLNVSIQPLADIRNKPLIDWLIDTTYLQTPTLFCHHISYAGYSNGMVSCLWLAYTVAVRSDKRNSCSCSKLLRSAVNASVTQVSCCRLYVI